VNVDVLGNAEMEGDLESVRVVVGAGAAAAEEDR
jgi:hypothetical protein